MISLSEIFSRIKTFFTSPPEYKTPMFDPNNYIVDPNETLAAALEKRGLLVKLRFPEYFGLHAINEGEIVSTIQNGMPKFIIGKGRFTLWSFFNKLIKKQQIKEKLIEAGTVQILTVKQGELALTVKNGKNIILGEGRYILQAPHTYEKSALLKDNYIELGTHRRIAVPEGHVCLGYDKGSQVIILPHNHPFKLKDPKDPQIIVAPADKPYITDSDSFSYTGLQVTRIKEVELDKLKVNTREMMPLEVVGLIRYSITDPKQAFFNVDDVHKMMKLQAEATLTSVFTQLSVRQLSIGLASTNLNNAQGELSIKPEVHAGLISLASELFIKQFGEVVSAWGVKLDNLSILKMEFSDKSFLEAMRTRAQQITEAETQNENLKLRSDVIIGEARRDAEQRQIRAEAEAKAIVTLADAHLYAAKKNADAAVEQSKNPLGAQLAILRLEIEKVKAMGHRTSFVPSGVKLDIISGPTLFPLVRDQKATATSAPGIESQDNVILRNM